jgi:hypothetical protein
MSHLSPERLAALVDDAPSSTELAHLVACTECARERASYSALTALTKSAPTLDVPLTTWGQLAPSLRKHGVIAGPPRGVVYRTARMSMRIAAGVTLIVGGMAAGRMSAGARVVPSVAELRGGTTTFASLEAAEQARVDAELRWDAASKFIMASATPALARESRDEVQKEMSGLWAIRRIARSIPRQDPTIDRIVDLTTSQYNARYQTWQATAPATVSQTVY